MTGLHLRLARCAGSRFLVNAGESEYAKQAIENFCMKSIAKNIGRKRETHLLKNFTSGEGIRSAGELDVTSWLVTIIIPNVEEWITRSAGGEDVD